MSTERQRHIGEAPVMDSPKRNFNLVIGDNKIKTKHIKDKQVTPEKLSDSVKTVWLASYLKDWYNKNIKPIWDVLHGENNSLDAKYKTITDELYSMISSLQVGGIALSDRLGDREDIGITQKALTEILNTFNERINDIAGEWAPEFSMTVSPDSFISIDTAQVNITANAGNGKFEHIAFYVNEELVTQGDQVSVLTDTTTIDKTSEIKCVASILGKTYVKTKTVTKYYPFFLGGGTSIEEVLVPENAREYKGSLIGSYDVAVNAGDRIYLYIPNELQSELIRLDMNGFEIPMTVTSDDTCTTYESKNTYQAGTYNIDITNNRE